LGELKQSYKSESTAGLNEAAPQWSQNVLRVFQNIKVGMGKVTPHQQGRLMYGVKREI